MASVPFTPRASSSTTRQARLRASGVALSREQESKIAHTLASVRKAKPANFLAVQQEEDEEDSPPRRPPSVTSTDPSARRSGVVGESSSSHRPKEHTSRRRSGKERESTPSDSNHSFTMLPESSFFHNPLASRQPPPVPSHAYADTSTERISLLKDCPIAVQEAWVLQDLKSVLIGLEGELVFFDREYDPADEYDRLKGPEWDVDPGLDPSLLVILRRILSLATYYVAVEAFADSRGAFEFGMVNHALASGLRDALREFVVFLTQIETLIKTDPSFTLQTCFFLLRESLGTFALLYALTTALIEAEEVDEDDEDGDGGESESSEDEAAAKLGLGGKKLKELMGGNAALGGGGVVKGGEVLDLIWRMGRNRSGDPMAGRIFSTLLLKASQPYAEMLTEWVSSGRLRDTHEEFMVREATSITKKQLDLDFTDEYWDRRYTLRDGSTVSQTLGGPGPTRGGGIPAPRRVKAGSMSTDPPRLPGGACVPTFLAPWKHKVLLAGKYLNVLRECGIDDETARDLARRAWPRKDGLVDLLDESFFKQIEQSYIDANQTLLRLLIREQDLLSHLRSLKHHFFLAQSSFATHFLEHSMSELAKDARECSLVKLQSILDISLSTSGVPGAASEATRDNVRVVLASERLYDFLSKVVNQSGDLKEDAGGGRSKSNGLPGSGSKSGGKEKEKIVSAYELLQLDYTVKFPVSLVISRKTIARYQLLLRFLLQLKHAEASLGLLWTEHTSPPWRTSRRTGDADLERWKTRVFALRARMLSFVQHMLAFVTGEVLEPNWAKLEDKLANVETVDGLLNDHVDFLDTCLKEAALTKADLIDNVAKVVGSIQVFFVNSKQFTRFALEGADLAATPASEDDTERAALREEKARVRSDYLARFEKNFGRNLQLYSERIGFFGGSENTALMPLVVRLSGLTDGGWNAV